MRRSFDALDGQDNTTQLKWAAGVAAAFGLAMVALVALTGSPTATAWVSDAAHAELVASTMTTDPAPVRIAAERVR
jgi:LDH2 family malate/lactate/ureidoglycolate dehydrogenase